jgi:ABC-2 type transport system ATP-binding protein
MNAIEAKSLQKVFTTRQGFWRQKRKSTVAVEDVSFQIEKGELFGLLGPNGAGKTTTVKMLTTILLPTKGSGTILGYDLVKDTRNIRQHIGFTFGGARGLYGRLTAKDNLRYFAELYALEPSFAKTRIAEMLDMVGLASRADDRVETYSSGMQQRLHLARALLHNPDVLFLDEPTVGIDPVGARELRQTVRELKKAGKTILLTTHYMAEAEELCDRIAIVNKGRIIAMDTPANLRRRISPESVVEITVSAENVELIQQLIKHLDSKLRVESSSSLNEQHFNLYTPEPETVLQALSPALQARSIQGLQVRNQTMEDVYIALIGEINRYA